MQEQQINTSSNTQSLTSSNTQFIYEFQHKLGLRFQFSLNYLNTLLWSSRRCLVGRVCWHIRHQTTVQKTDQTSPSNLR